MNIRTQIFEGDQVVKGTELNQVLPKEVYKDETVVRAANVEAGLITG